MRPAIKGNVLELPFEYIPLEVGCCVDEVLQDVVEQLHPLLFELVIAGDAGANDEPQFIICQLFNSPMQALDRRTDEVVEMYETRVPSKTLIPTSNRKLHKEVRKSRFGNLNEHLGCRCR